MNRDLLAVFDAQWRELRRTLAGLQAAVDRTARQERAEVAASVPVVAALVDLPAAGQVGRLMAVSVTGALYFDDGTTWREVTLT